MAERHILLVEDDENLRLTLAENLVDEGYAVEAAADGRAASAAMSRGEIDLVILDIMLPDTDGYALCRQWRGAGVTAPVLMLTARTLEEDLVRGFDAGADDYVAKPYRLAELFARVRALLRRGGLSTSSEVRFGDFRLDLERRVLDGPEGEVPLTPKELELLAYFLQHRGRALHRQQILDDVWGRDVIVDARTIDNFVSNLKKKLRWTPQAAFKITTVRGVGYRFEV